MLRFEQFTASNFNFHLKKMPKLIFQLSSNWLFRDSLYLWICFCIMRPALVIMGSKNATVLNHFPYTLVEWYEISFWSLFLTCSLISSSSKFDEVEMCLYPVITLLNFLKRSYCKAFVFTPIFNIFVMFVMLRMWVKNCIVSWDFH